MSLPQRQTPWWERPPKRPGQPNFEPERERLRAELARAWRACVGYRYRPGLDAGGRRSH